MSQKWIKFNRNISDPLFIPKMERQFLEFPNWDHDDIIDTVAQAKDVFTKRWEVEKKPVQEAFYSNWWHNEEVYNPLDRFINR